MQNQHAKDRRPEAALWCVDDLAAVMRVSSRTVWKWIASDRLPEGAVVRLGRSVRIRREVVERWIASGCPGAGMV